MQNVFRKTILIVCLAISIACRAQQNTETIQQYINTYKEIAIAEMQRTGVPAAITLAQGIHETEAGTSDLVLKSNNHFGIKCKNTWTGASVTHDDDLRGECFRKYNSAEESYRDHSDFLKGNTRYAFLFNFDPEDYKDWAYGIKKAGYATNPHYPQIIIKLIEDYHLQDYTMIALGKKAAINDGLVKTEVKEAPGQTTPVVAAMVNTDIPEKTIVQHAVTKTGTVETSFTDHPVQNVQEPLKRMDAPARMETPRVMDQPQYPESLFKLNETSVIYARKGTSFLAIAQQYNIPLARIFDFNDMLETESVNKDQLIYLQRKRKTGNDEFHTVQAGETLHDIAQTEAIRLETLLEYNLLGPDMKPAIGEKLYLRVKAPSAPRLVLKNDYALYAVSPNNAVAATNPVTPVTLTNEKSFVSYVVQPKETIYSVAKRYNVKIDDLVKWNQLSGYDLKAGQTLKIYK